MPGAYKVAPAERFGEKLSIGPLKYSDFNPYESGFAISNMSGGYGLDRYSDEDSSSKRETMPSETFPQGIPILYKESSNVDCRVAGSVHLSPLINVEGLTGAVASPSWIGDFKGKVYAQAGVKLYERSVGGGWTLTYTFAQAPTCIAVFNDLMIVGFGASAVYSYSADLVTWTAGSEYVFAATADRAALYIAGGTATTDFNEVISSADGITFEGTPVKCGDPSIPITSLAPGGGACILFVGKEDCLGEIDWDAQFNVLVPFDTRLSSNCKPMRWWLSSGAAEQRGPVVVLFSRDRMLWEFQPSGDSAGSAKCLSPWAAPSRQPPNAKGETTAIQGTSRYLFYAIRNAAGHSWIICRDGANGGQHTLLDLGTNDCRAVTVSSSFGTNPVLIFGRGLGIGYVTLPLDGDIPTKDSACRFALTGTLDLPGIDFMFPDEWKRFYGIRILADDVVAGQQVIDVSVSMDGGEWITLGTVDETPSEEIALPQTIKTKRMDVRLTFTTNDSAKTPKLRGIVVRGALITTLKREWTFQTLLPGGENALGGEDLSDPHLTLDAFWDDVAEGASVPFTDRWGTEWTVRIETLEEMEIAREADRTPLGVMSLKLIEIAKGAGNVNWDDPLFIWDAPSLIWG